MSAAAVLALSMILGGEPPPPSMFVDEKPEPYQVAERYLRTSDLTILALELEDLSVDKPARLRLTVDQVTTGRGRSGPGKGLVRLHFSNGPFQRQSRYQQDNSVALRADGEPLHLRVEDYRNREESIWVQESVDVLLSRRKDLLRLTAARAVEGSIGAHAFRLEARQVTAINDFARYVIDPTLPVKPTVPSDPNVMPYPDRSAIASGHGVLRSPFARRPCVLTREIRSIEESEEISENATTPSLRLQESRKKLKQQEERGERVNLPSGTQVRMLERIERPSSRMNRWLTRVEVVDGPHKGLRGWCESSVVVSSLKTASDRDAAEAEVIWQTSRSLEGRGDRKLALAGYRDLVRLFPETSRGKQAVERIKALTGQ